MKISLGDYFQGHSLINNSSSSNISNRVGAARVSDNGIAIMPSKLQEIGSDETLVSKMRMCCGV